MEGILQDILSELKEIRKDIGGKPDSITLKVSTGDEILVEKVIKSINKQNRISRGATIVV